MNSSFRQLKYELRCSLPRVEPLGPCLATPGWTIKDEGGGDLLDRYIELKFGANSGRTDLLRDAPSAIVAA